MYVHNVLWKLLLVPLQGVPDVGMFRKGMKEIVLLAEVSTVFCGIYDSNFLIGKNIK